MGDVIRVPIKDSDEVVEIPVADLPEDAGEVIEVSSVLTRADAPAPDRRSGPAQSVPTNCGSHRLLKRSHRSLDTTRTGKLLNSKQF